MPRECGLDCQACRLAVAHLADLAADPSTRSRYGHLRDGESWHVRDDVFISYHRNPGDHRSGGLSVGYGGNRDQIGPELGFGTAVGESLDDAMQTAARDVGASLLLAALTTSLGFAAFVPTDFTGVAELGVIAGGGMLGLVDGTKGLHETAPQKCVTISFFTEQIETWFAHVQTIDGFKLRTPEIKDESGRVNIFVGYDPEGYFLEWDQFLPLDENQRLIESTQGV